MTVTPGRKLQILLLFGGEPNHLEFLEVATLKGPHPYQLTQRRSMVFETPFYVQFPFIIAPRCVADLQSAAERGMDFWEVLNRYMQRPIILHAQKVLYISSPSTITIRKTL
jgi:hypothetical protein